MTLPGTYNSFMSIKSGIEFVGRTSSYVISSSSTTTLDVSTIAKTGDYLILTSYAYSASNPTSTPLMNTTVVTNTIVNDTSVTHRRYLISSGFYTGINPTITGASIGILIVTVFVFRGVNETTPLDISASTSPITVIDNVPTNLGSMTTVTSSSYTLWVCLGQINLNSNDMFTGWTNSNISNSAELFDYATDVSNGAYIACWGGILVPLGSSGSTTVTPTVSATSGVSKVFRFALRAA